MKQTRKNWTITMQIMQKKRAKEGGEKIRASEGEQKCWKRKRETGERERNNREKMERELMEGRLVEVTKSSKEKNGRCRKVREGGKETKKKIKM